MANEKRLIDANALVKKILSLTLIVTGLRAGKGVLLELLMKYQKGILQAINEQPAVDAVEVVHGEWVHDYNNLYGCSECMERETMSPKKLKNYCPNCGAKMDGDGNGSSA